MSSDFFGGIPAKESSLAASTHTLDIGLPGKGSVISCKINFLWDDKMIPEVIWELTQEISNKF